MTERNEGSGTDMIFNPQGPQMPYQFKDNLMQNPKVNSDINSFNMGTLRKDEAFNNKHMVK